MRRETLSQSQSPLVQEAGDGNLHEVSVGDSAMERTGLGRLPPLVQYGIWIVAGVATSTAVAGCVGLLAR